MVDSVTRRNNSIANDSFAVQATFLHEIMVHYLCPCHLQISVIISFAAVSATELSFPLLNKSYVAPSTAREQEVLQEK